jgi:hypothetical protein
MKCLPLVLLFCVAVPCGGQTPYSPAVADAASQVLSIQEGLKYIQVGEMDTAVPVEARDQLTQLKDALSCAADAILAHAGPSIDPVELQNRMADSLNANLPESTENKAVSSDDHRTDETSGPYGQGLRVRVRRPPNVATLLEVEFSVDVTCGDDHMLLIYGLHDGAWKRQIRWQAPPLEKVSDAFGDFFLSAALSTPGGGDSRPRVVVAHGMPWCTSRFSGFGIDILSPAPDSDLPKVLWHTERGYDRSDFTPKLKSSGDTFEFRVNASSMDIESFERRVIYRYRVDERQDVRRIEPIATNARGFVEEWLFAPWPESQSFSAQEASSVLQLVHEQFTPPVKSDTEFVTHSYGPVRSCNAPGAFQVQINSTLFPGKPGGESQPLPSHYFHVREIEDGYLMVSAPTEPDPACRGANLMPTKGR